MEERLKKMQERAEREDPEFLLRICISHFNRLATSEKLPPVVIEAFEEDMREAIKKIALQYTDRNPIPMFTIMIEEFAIFLGTARVTGSAVDPYSLEDGMNLSKNQVDLLRRGIEDYLLSLTTDIIKKVVLSNHVDFSEALATGREKE